MCENTGLGAEFEVYFQVLKTECKINEGELWLLVNVKISLMLLFSHLCGPEFIS